jgi:putative sterol carrier protein
VSEAAPDPHSYFVERLPAQFDRALRQAERAVESAQRVLDGMRAVRTTFVVEVRGEGGGRFVLNVDGGLLSTGDAPAHPVALTLAIDRRDFEPLIRDAGDAALGFLGGLSGLAGEMKLTKSRLDLLAGVRGSLRFEVKGDDGFSLVTHFGDGPPREPPDTVIRVAPDVYAELRAGRLDAQSAFMTGKLEIEGDMQLAMQVALAAMAPD